MGVEGKGRGDSGGKKAERGGEGRERKGGEGKW